jgi:hypothetical protein
MVSAVVGRYAASDCLASGLSRIVAGVFQGVFCRRVYIGEV